MCFKHFVKSKKFKILYSFIAIQLHYYIILIKNFNVKIADDCEL